ncbi:ExsB family transcriptional regulator [candidate division FCPU426 bacterium]|nr:ExsB family transcriptional regulator [candidate division FCPU426 bacterium]
MQTLKEIQVQDLVPDKFIAEKVRDIADTVKDGIAVNALSGGVDSAAVTMLAHQALGERLKTYFIDNGIMREGEPAYIVGLFAGLGVKVELVDARDEFFRALDGILDPEEKRQAITDTFYKNVFGRLVRESGAKYLLQGTNFTDVEETVAGIKRQHNILEQLGINTQEAYGYKVLEPIIALRKTGVRTVAKALGLPEEIYTRPPFPGPALVTRCIGPVTRERIAIVRKATAIVEEVLRNTAAFQYLAILHEDRVTGIKENKRSFGRQIEVRCWDSTDAVTGVPTRLPFELLEQLGERIPREIPEVVSVTYNITRKPPSTIEAI